MAITVGCPVVATSPKDVASEGFETTCKDITSATIVAARKIEDNVKPSKQGDSIVPVTAAEFKDGVSLVVKDGRLVQAPKIEKMQHCKHQKIEENFKKVLKINMQKIIQHLQKEDSKGQITKEKDEVI